MATKYISLEEAAQRLGLQPKELLQLREDGQIRGFADQGTWKFRVEDVEEFARSRQADSDPDVRMLDEPASPEAGGSSTILGQESEAGSSVVSGSDVVSGSSILLGDEGAGSDVTPAGEPGSSVVLGEEAEEDELGAQPTIVRKGSEISDQPRDSDEGSDSDVRLILDDSLAGEEAAPASAESGPVGEEDSDSDVRLVGEDEAAEEASDSDVKLISEVEADEASDSDVKLVGAAEDDEASDSDVKLVGGEESDSDVRLTEQEATAPEMGSDSDVQLIGQPTGEGSDSDVRLVSPPATVKEGSDSDVTLVPARESEEEPVDSGISLAPEQADSGITLEGEEVDSGISLVNPADSGIALEAADSGIALEAPVDSGISLADDDEGITLEAADSGIALEGGGESRGSTSGTIPMVDAVSEEPEGDETQLEVPLLDDEESDFDLAAEDSAADTSVILFDDEEEQPDDHSATVVGAVEDEDEVFEQFETPGEEFGEVDVFAEEPEAAEAELEDLEVFEPAEGDFGESFTAGESREFVAPPGAAVAPAVEQEWGALTFLGLVASTALLSVCAMMMFDLVRTMWAWDSPSAFNSRLLDLIGGMFSK